VRVSRPGSLYQTSNIAYRRDALRAAGGFDVDFIGWFEDTALAARVLRNGPIGFASNAVVVHRAMPRRALGRSDWQALLHDERLLARRYPDFYLRTRGPGPLVTIVVRWVLGSPLKTLLRELQRAVDDPEGFGLLVRSLLEERRTLLRVLLDERRSGYR
jgi:GT2 family glycosyltransferase